MAAFSPKDLMSPMKKMEVSLEEIKKTNSSVVEAVVGIQSNTSVLAIIQSDISVIRDTLSSISLKLGIKKIKEKLKSDVAGASTRTKNGIEMFASLGLATKDFAGGLLLFKYISKKEATNVADCITTVVKSVSDIDKEAAKSISALGNIGESIFTFSSKIAKSLPMALIANLAIKPIVNVITKFATLLSNKETLESLKNAVDATKDLGEVGKSILTFEKTIALAALLVIPATVAMPVIALQLKFFSKLLGGKETQEGLKNAIESTKDLEQVGRSILVFEGTMVLAGILAIPATIVTAFVAFQIIIFSTLLGSKETQAGLKNAIESTKDLGQVGKSILAFEGTLLLAGILAIPVIALTPLIFVTLGIAFFIGKIFGKQSGDMKKGAVSLLILSAGLIVFSIGLIIFGNAVESLSWEGILMGGVVLAIFGGAAIGLGAVSQLSILGAVAFILIGIGLIAFSKGISVYGQEIRQWEWKDEAMAAAVLGTMTVPIIGLGFAPVALMAATGAGVLLLIGKALVEFSNGLSHFSEITWTEKNTINLYNAVTGVTNALLGIDTEKDRGFFKRLGKAVNQTAKWKLVKEGADGIIQAGKGLAGLAIGLKLIKNLEWDDTYTEQLNKILACVSVSFASIAGGSDKTVSESFNNIIKTFSVDAKTVKKGINSVKGTGKALKDISQGLIDFTNWYNTNAKKIDIKDEKSEFRNALENSLTAISSAFAAVGGEGQVTKRFGIFKWDKNKVKEGIDSVRGVGDALKGISTGLVEFVNWYNNNLGLFNDTKDAKGNTIPKQSGIFFQALDTTINGVAKAFANINDKDKNGWKAKDVYKGIQSVQDIQTALTDISTGLNNYINNAPDQNKFDNSKKMIDDLCESMVKLSNVKASAAGSAFEKFGKGFSKGLETIYKKKEATTNVNSIRSLILTMENAINLNVYDKTADGINKIAKAVNTIDTDKGKAFSNLFVAASNLKNNSRFYNDLKKAVEDIRNILNENGYGNSVPAPASASVPIAEQRRSSNDRQVAVSAAPAAPAAPKMPKELKVTNLTITAETVNVNS